jgi:hypothetical protein
LMHMITFPQLARRISESMSALMVDKGHENKQINNHNATSATATAIGAVITSPGGDGPTADR